MSPRTHRTLAVLSALFLALAFVGTAVLVITLVLQALTGMGGLHG